jgi:hypothetical protein
VRIRNQCGEQPALFDRDHIDPGWLVEFEVDATVLD